MQRTLFPAIPNTAEAQWLSTVQALYQELTRHDGQRAFKLFRGWMRDRNIYVKEEVEELLEFLDCSAKPAVMLRHFGRTFLECETPQAQKVTMFRWLMGWNPLLVKAVFEALDTESGGRLHSTHELYRMITSYAYAGERITLPSFQAWIKWMAATEHIRYIGIRWGLGELGKEALPSIKHIDVDEFLEDEEEAREAGIAEVHPMLDGVAQESSSPATAVPDTPAPRSDAPPDVPAPSEPEVSSPPPAEDVEDLPDMPPEAPVRLEPAPSETPATSPPASQPPSPVPEAQPKVPTPRRRPVPGAASTVALPGWFPASPRPSDATAAELGFEATQYGGDPALFIYRLACAARLQVSGLPSDAWRSLFTMLDTEAVFERYFTKKRPMEEILSGLQWLGGTTHRAALGWIVMDLMQLRKVLEDRPGYAGQLEQKSPAEALYSAHHELFAGATDGASTWFAKQMQQLELWEK